MPSGIFHEVWGELGSLSALERPALAGAAS